MGTASAIVEAKRAVIFDLFHTLTALESTWGGGRAGTYGMLGVSREAWQRQLLENSWERLIGAERDPVAIVTRMAHAIDPTISQDRIQAAVENRIERFAAALIEVPEPVQQVLRTLKRRGKLLGLISNADVMEVAAWEHSPIARLFDAVVLSCEVGCAKPGREIYQICLRRLGVKAGQAVFIGDGGSNELQGAREVGMATILMAGIIRQLWPEKIAQRAGQADCVIDGLCELLASTAA